MPKNYLLIYSEQLATEIELLCQSIKAPSNTLFQIRKSSSSIYANIREANYGQSKADMLSKFEIALKECSETEGWLRLLFNTNAIDEEIYKKHFTDVYRYILKLSGDEHIAEDITSETFLKAIKSIDSFRGDCDVRVWLCQIAKNSYYSYIKRTGKTLSIDEHELFELPDTALSVAEEYVKQDEIERIQRILHGISEPYKEVFMWRVYADLSFKQIAQIFGKTDNWACVTYHRARKMILERLEEMNDEN